MARDLVKILDGSTFAVSDRVGNIDAGPEQPHGLFFKDTRYLSKWVLSMSDGRPLQVLSTDEFDYFSAQFFLCPSTGTIHTRPALSVMRERTVGDGVHEDVRLRNHSKEPVEVSFEIEAGADFADLFEVKDALKKKGEHYREVRDGVLVLGYRREDFVRETHVSSDEAEVDEGGLRFTVKLEGHGEWQTCIEVIPHADRPARPKHGHGSISKAAPNMRMSLEQWINDAPKLETSWDKLGHVYWRSLVDLAALRFYPEILPDASLPAAGLPWFMALFGRDSILTSYQSLPYCPELAETTLRVLAARQGEQADAFRDEEPGKILHELRFGELTHFNERPHSPYYGTADATPLFLVLLDEYQRWTGDDDLVRELEPNARAALTWIDEHGDRDGDGYVEYKRGNDETGLENQCWKDSWNSMLFADGTNSMAPRAVVEIQGYVYDAKVRAARLAREIWNDPELAERLDGEAAELKERFNRDFWVPDREFYALALDGQKKQVDSLTSNIGHLLWSGIVPEDRARSVVRHLMGDDMFTGWGVRTMASTEGGYNPIEYHNGTVWPHDNSFIAAGLRRYGYTEEAARIGYALLEAATYFDWRLPEVFAGYPRSLTSFPVEYPTASSPQAWATGTPLLLLTTMLGVEPDGDGLRSAPVLPAEITRVGLNGIRGRTWKNADVIGG